MKRLKIILQSRYLFKILTIIFLMLSITYTKYYSFKSKYNEDETEFIGIVKDYTITDNKIKIILKAKEVLIVEYKYNNLTATNKREELLLNVLRYDFVLTELNLYLDIYPKDRNMINLYNQYLEEKKRACFEYTKNLGPLSLDDQSYNKSWSWLQSPWPWEGTK